MYAGRYFPKRYFAERYFPPTAADGGWEEYPTGGIEFDGAADSSYTYVLVPEGGLTFAGDPTIEYTSVESASGGITFGGSASQTWVAAGAAARRRWYRLGVGVTS